MSTTEFDIIFRGDIVMGHQLADVKQRMQQLFKVDAEKVDALFSGRPVPLKRNLDEATARKYQEVLLKAGAQVQLSPSGSVNLTPPPEPQVRRQWSLAPVGAYLLTPTERPKTPAVLIDTSRLHLHPAEGHLLDAVENPRAPAVAVTVPDLDLAEVGADLLTEEEKPALPLVELKAGEDWSLAEPGADLITAHERPPAAAPVGVSSDFQLAPVGADLGQIKLPLKPVEPDISGLSLAD